MTEPSEPRGNEVPSWEWAACAVLLAWFAVRVVILALQIKPHIPPDEITHFGRVLAYTAVWGVPDNGPATFELGLIDQRPWLYYWTLARVQALNLFGLPELVFARLVNGLLGLATALVAILWIREWCRSPWARLLFLVLVTNTLMFTALSASVSYDNGANLLAAGALLAFTRLRARPSLRTLLALSLLVLGGCLVKRTFLPLAFLFVVLLGIREARRLPGLLRELPGALRTPSTAALLVGTILLAGLGTSLYGGNWLRHGKLAPDFDQVVGLQNAMSNRVFARGRILDEFLDGELSAGEARAKAERVIRHRGDRNGTLLLLKTAQEPDSSLMGPVAYVGSWASTMLRSSVAYTGHVRLKKGDGMRAAYTLVFAAAALLLAWRWRPGAAGGVPADAAFLVLGYAGVLMWLVHYPAYQKFHYPELAVQGRYLFLVLLPIQGLVAWALAELTPERARPWLAACVGSFFLYGDLPWMLQHLDPRWVVSG